MRQRGLNGLMELSVSVLWAWLPMAAVLIAWVTGGKQAGLAPVRCWGRVLMEASGPGSSAWMWYADSKVVFS